MGTLTLAEASKTTCCQHDSSHLLHLVALIDQDALARLHARQRAEARVDVDEPLAQVLHSDSLKRFRKHVQTQSEECQTIVVQISLSGGMSARVRKQITFL